MNVCSQQTNFGLRSSPPFRVSHGSTLFPTGPSAEDPFHLNPDERPSFQKPEFPTAETAQVRRGMKANWIAAVLCGLLAAWPGAGPGPAQPTLGLPEPSLLRFGSVTNAAGGLPLPPPAVTWQISSGPDLVTVPAMAVGAFYSVAEMVLFFSLTLG